LTLDRRRLAALAAAAALLAFVPRAAVADAG
jgi:hypothetical protein